MHAIPVLLLVISSFSPMPPPSPVPNISSLHPLDTPPPAPQVNSTSPTDATTNATGTDTAVES